MTDDAAISVPQATILILIADKQMGRHGIRGRMHTLIQSVIDRRVAPFGR
jgi:hypothetical protein